MKSQGGNCRAEEECFEELSEKSQSKVRRIEKLVDKLKIFEII